MSSRSSATGEGADTISVLVADDSPLFAHSAQTIIESDPELKLVGIASNGKHAVELTKKFSPNVIMMDVRMPVMDGLSAIAEIMAVRPTPILVVTSDPEGKSGEVSFEALRRGALEVMPKPRQWPGTAAEQQCLREQLKFFAKVPVVPHIRAGQAPTSARPHFPARAVYSRLDAVGIVASTGGPAALARILARLPRDYAPCILIVQHIAQGFTENLASWLSGMAAIEVRVARPGAQIEPGVAWLAPDGLHMVVEPSGRLRLTEGPPNQVGHRPSGTLLLASLARAYGPSAAGVILTGMGDDGVAGLLELRRAGGVTIAQDQASSVVFGMPRAAREAGAAMRVLSLDEIPSVLVQLARRHANPFQKSFE